MKPEDGFLRKFQFKDPDSPGALKDFYNQWDLEERFGSPEGKTVGAIVVSIIMIDNSSIQQ